MYTREEFVERFKGMETSWLANRLATTEMTDEARAAIYDILQERGAPVESLKAISTDLPADEIAEHAHAIRRSQCPRCGRTGGLDVRKSYWVWSAGYITRWETKSAVCCRICGRKENWKAIGFSFGLGWWGIPSGIILTPYQILRNILALAKGADSRGISLDLLGFAKTNLLERRQLEIEQIAP